MLPFHDVVKEEFDAVNQLILKELHSDISLVENIGQHLIDAGGKRLRPLLVLLTAKACGYSGQNHIPLATVIEFIHTATLLHDDVVDTSELRRGRTTANAKWGNAPSVLVGDFLYSRAFQIMVALGDLRIMQILADTTNIVSEGEVQQLINAGNADISEQNYLTVINKKTAQLFEAAAQTGAVIAGANTKLTTQMAIYGHDLGMAFQLVDDALDYSGDTVTMGKNIGDDLAEGKPTLPLIHVIKTGTKAQANLVKNAIINADINNMDAVLTAISQTDAINYTLSVARRYVTQAQNALAALPESKEKTALQVLTEFSLKRTF